MDHSFPQKKKEPKPLKKKWRNKRELKLEAGGDEIEKLQAS